MVDATSCSLETRNGASGPWVSRITNPALSCAGGSATIQAPAWCSTEGLNECGVRISATGPGGGPVTGTQDFSIDLTNPVVSITDPLAGSAQAGNFDITYDATDTNISACQLFTKDGAAAWQSRGVTDCGAGKTKTIFTAAWCTSTGVGSCGVRVRAQDLAGNSAQDERFFSINGPPVADAGADQNINFGLPSVQVTLTGTVTDDGVPGPYTVEWRLIAGDATKITIASPNAETTDVTFTGSGGYRFELVANDGSATDSDTVDIRVRNNAPAVSIAGSVVVEVKFGFLPITLQGIANDDGLPAPPGNIILQWAASGPGTATFSNPTGTNTELQLSQAGVYLITFRADDGEFTAQANVEVRYASPADYGLIPCGMSVDNPATPWSETDRCELRHTLLLLRNVVDFSLWRLVPLLIAVLVVVTGATFLFQFGGPEVMAKVRGIWSQVGKGVLILLFSWLFLNFFLGILGFDISIFGQWYNITP